MLWLFSVNIRWIGLYCFICGILLSILAEARCDSHLGSKMAAELKKLFRFFDASVIGAIPTRTDVQLQSIDRLAELFVHTLQFRIWTQYLKRLTVHCPGATTSFTLCRESRPLATASCWPYILNFLILCLAKLPPWHKPFLLEHSSSQTYSHSHLSAERQCEYQRMQHYLVKLEVCIKPLSCQM